MSTIPASGVEETTAVPSASATSTQPAAGNEPKAGKQPVTQTSPPQTEPPNEEDSNLDEAPLVGQFVLFNAVPSSIVSGVVHFVGFLILALLTIPPPVASETLAIQAPVAERVEKVEELQEEKLSLKLDTTISDDRSEVVQQVLQNVVAADTPGVAIDVDAAPIQVDLSDFGERTAPKSDLMATVGAAVGSGLSGRGATERGMMVAQVGGTSDSEAAVANALKWFVEHQNHDGSWNFDHRTGPCQGRCSDSGTLDDCRTGATAMALLPFLGAGQTHQQGQYKQNVERGIYFLTNQMKVRNEGGMQGGDLAQGRGSMYSHGLAAIVLCEAYAMTHDRKLMNPAQLSLNHIVYAQDPIGGGWRYAPRQPGDTSVVGWQLMALKSGHMAYLVVPPATIQGAIKFLDSAQADDGAKYGYTGPGQGQGTTAVGLLCRMYLGWKHENAALKRGVEYLSRLGPSRGNMYYNYYATQVMRQYCGDPGTPGHEMWEKWNNNLRDWLVGSQEKTGHAKGSWIMKGDHGSERGGRLYCTSMATMILEVYYRHMPIYGKQAATEEFPL
jgi:hypothetical protein